MNRVLEIRSYIIKANMRSQFHKTVREISFPLMLKWGIDVVAFGPSMHDENSYVLMRSYKDESERQKSQAEFYGSDEWKKGPRESIVSLIESDTNIVIEVNASIIEALRNEGIGSK